LESRLSFPWKAGVPKEEHQLSKGGAGRSGEEVGWEARCTGLFAPYAVSKLLPIFATRKTP